MAGPAMNFRTEDMLDDQRVKHGPLAVFWGQEEVIEPNRKLPDIPAPRRSLMDRLFRRRAFRLDIRIAPPEGEDLDDFGKRLGDRLGLEVAESREGDRAIGLIGSGNYRTASHALGASGRVFSERLAGLTISAAQVFVTGFPAK